MNRLLLLLFFITSYCWGQCGKQVPNPITGQSDCIGTGSGGGISGLTTGTIPKAASSTTLADSPISDDGTTVSVTGRNLQINATVLSGGASASTPGFRVSNLISGSAGMLAAYNGSGGSGYAMGLAQSNDGYTFQKLPNAPVLTKGTTGQWDATQIKDPALLKVFDTYYMYYTGVNASNVGQVGLATSRDGFTWTKYVSNPVVANAAFSGSVVTFERFPTVVYDPADADASQRWKMWAENNQAGIDYFYSADGLSWTAYSGNPVLALSASGAWDNLKLIPTAAIRVGTTWNLYYCANNNSDDQQFAIELATFTNPKSSYTRSPSNPILPPRHTASAALTGTTSTGSTTVTVADTSLFTVNEYVWLANGPGDGTVQLTRVVAINSGTSLTIRDVATKDYTVAAGGVLRSIYYNAVLARTVMQQDGGYIGYGTCFANFNGGALREVPCAFTGTTSSTGWTYDFNRGVPIQYGTWDSTNIENLSIIPLTGDQSNYFIRLLYPTDTALGLGFTPTLPNAFQAQNFVATPSTGINLASSGIGAGLGFAGPSSRLWIFDWAYTSGGFDGWSIFSSSHTLFFNDTGESNRMTLTNAGNLSVDGNFLARGSGASRIGGSLTVGSTTDQSGGNGGLYTYGTGEIYQQLKSTAGSGTNVAFRLTGGASGADWMWLTNRGDLMANASDMCLFHIGGACGYTLDASGNGIQKGHLTLASDKATSGTRYLCVDTNGLISASASACSGT